MKFHENPSSGSDCDTCEQRHGDDRGSSRFSRQFCEGSRNERNILNFLYCTLKIEAVSSDESASTRVILPNIIISTLTAARTSIRKIYTGHRCRYSGWAIRGSKLAGARDLSHLQSVQFWSVLNRELHSHGKVVGV